LRAEAGVSYYAARRRRQARARVLKRVALATVGALVLAAVAAAIVYAGSSARLAAGERIGGLDVGGMTDAQARTLLDGRASSRARVPVAFIADGHRFRITAPQIGLRYDWAAAIAAAHQRAGGFAPLRGIKRLRLRLFGSDVAPTSTYDARQLRQVVARIAAGLDRPHRDATLVLHGLKPVVVPAVVGRTLDREAAATAIAAGLGSFARGNAIPLPMQVDRPRVTRARLRPALAQTRTALSAPVRLTLGGTVYRLPRWRLAQLLELPTGGQLRLRVGGAGADRYFARLEKAVDAPPTDARFVLGASGAIHVAPSVDGKVLDVPRTAKALLAAALSPTDRRAQIVVATKAPDRTTEEATAMGITGVVSSYTTQFGGEPNRLHNVAVVAHLVDDKLIAPGETFSFNKTTGERNAQKGLLEAPVIINGELTTGLGGGTCQVSTTVFNAAYEAGLPIVERTNHALYISHYPQGRDATVNYPDVDLKFRNDTGHWLWLRTFESTYSLTVNLYGTPQHRKVDTITAPLRVTGAVPTETIEDPTLPKGQQVVDQAGSPPLSTSVERKVYAPSGKLLYDATFYSSYVGEKQVVRVGTKKPTPKPKPKPKQKAGLPVADVPALGPDLLAPTGAAAASAAQTITTPR
jgi:vancomycin resistance protein YoaR